MRVAHRFISALSWVVPRWRRAEWREEWQAELWQVEARGGSTMAFVIGAIPHLIVEWFEGWSPDQMYYDFKHAIRALLRSRGFALLAILLIALGVGANTTVFTIVNAALLRSPNGINDPDRLIQIGRGDDFDNWSYPLYQDFRARARTLEDLAAYGPRAVVIGGGAETETVPAQFVSLNYFSVLRARVARGRTFSAREDQPVVVISHDLWQSRFPEAPSVLGKALTIGGQPFQIVGVADAGFAGADLSAESPKLWIPLEFTPIATGGSVDRALGRGSSWIWLVGRLRDGSRAARAESELRGLFANLQDWIPVDRRDDLTVQPGLGLRPAERQTALQVSLLLMGIVGLVLLIACSNLAALLTARGAARTGEMTIRLAIGASRTRLLWQSLSEAALIGIAGSLLAYLLTIWSGPLAASLLPYDTTMTFEPDARVFAFALIVGLSSTLLFALLPAWRSVSHQLIATLRRESPSLTRGGRNWLRVLLVRMQLALSFVLLVCTGLLLRSLQRAYATDPGFRTDVLTIQISLPARPDTDPATLLPRWDRIFRQVSAVRGVRAIALASHVQGEGSAPRVSLWKPGFDFTKGPPPEVPYQAVDSAYFSTMGIALRRGRNFSAARLGPGEPAVLVNESFAKRYWPDGDALGQTLAGGLTGFPERRVMGVVADTRNLSVRQPPLPMAYFPMSQEPRARMVLHLQVHARSAALDAAIGDAIRAADPGAALSPARTVRDRLARSLGDVRMIAALSTTFGLLALLLAMTGVYGVVSYLTVQRRAEFGLRLALGASPARIAGLVLAQNGRIVGLGVMAGVLLAIASTRLLRSWVYGVSTLDPVTFVSIAGVLVVVTVLAALAPAARAALIPPLASLRQE
ncbi:MAG TPA: ABC transporter permease [Longimicrobiales bacterium]|nr:ABC transporter permease [Longimicrobiales bacterium]